MAKDYGILLENLLGRRYDEAKRESIVSDSFEESGYGKCLLYTLEAMEEIDPSYAYKTFSIAKRIQDKINLSFEKRGFKADFRYQGPIQTETNILLYGDVELMVLITPNGSKPWKEIQTLTYELMDILTRDHIYQRVDNSDKLKIHVTTQKPTCEVWIQPAVWLNNVEFRETRREIERGICEFHMKQKTLRRYLPFKNIARINARDKKTNGGLKNLIRLLRTLQRDSPEAIDLTEYEIAGSLYAIPDKQLLYNRKKTLSLLGVASAQLNRLITDQKYRETLVSPSEKELVFGTKPKVEALKLLKNSLDELMADLEEQLGQEEKNLYSDISY